MSKIRSSRGSLVDFDQLKIKAQLSIMPTTTEVTARASLVEERLNRRAARRLQQLARVAAKNIQQDADSSALEEFDIEEGEDGEEVVGSDEIQPIARKQVRTKGVLNENSSPE